MCTHLYPFILITHRQQTPLSDYLDFIHSCATAGISAVQLREKHASLQFLIEFGSQLKTILDPLHIPLIVNDNIDLAIQLNAAGVHLGQSDPSAVLARKSLKPDKVIGLSIEQEQQLLIANNLPINYIATTIFPSSSKFDIKNTIGIAGLKKLSQLSKHPIIAIGNINENNIQQVLSAGACGIAVISAIHNAKDPIIAIKNLRTVIDNNHNNLRGIYAE